MTIKSSFGQWLKQRRKTLDLTQDDLAQRIGCAAVTLRKLEADERRPSQQMAELLAEHLNIPYDERIAFVRFARGEAVDSAAPWGMPFHHPSNLLAQPTLLIGRDEDVAAVRKRLLQPESRLLTLIGPPGIGKTRLALQVAADVLDDFTDGVFFVALAPITDASLVLVTVANTLGVPDRGPRTPLQRLQAFLRDKQMLLVLDNFEQILAAAPDIAALLAALPMLKILVTSRAPLRIRQERQLPVAPLALPDLAHLPDVESVTHYAAITLFLERAQAVKPDFALTEENAAAVAAICTRLDGLPLAIELISARVKLLSPAALLERLRGRLMLQSDGLRDIEPRHRTLNAAIEWSYQLLSGDEQTLFRRLGMFVGGWTLEAAEAVCLENLNLNILDGLTSLLDKSLIKQATSSNGEPRYMMLETMREYALERLGATGELETIRERHAAYFLFLVETPAPTLTETQTRLWWDRLELEHPNFRAALTSCQTAQTGLRLAVAVSDFWQRRSYLTEGRNWLVTLLSFFDEGWTSQDEARTLRAQALDWLGMFCLFQDDTIAAEPPLMASLAEFRELKNTTAVIGVLWDYSVLFHVRGDFDHANAMLQEGLALSHASGYSEGVTMNLFFLGTVAYSQGDVPRARSLLEETLMMLRAVGDIWVIAAVLRTLAMIAFDEEDYDKARVYSVESLTQLREMDERWQIIHTLEVFARLATVEGQQPNDRHLGFVRSARLFGSAEALREIFGAAMIVANERRFNERGIAALRSQLDEATLGAAWAEGRAMTLEQAVAYALEG